jgi:hypothetical protein
MILPPLISPTRLSTPAFRIMALLLVLVVETFCVTFRLPVRVLMLTSPAAETPPSSSAFAATIVTLLPDETETDPLKSLPTLDMLMLPFPALRFVVPNTDILPSTLIKPDAFNAKFPLDPAVEIASPLLKVNGPV